MTENGKERIESAQWVFDKTLGWISAAEVKVGAISAIDTAMLAGLGALFISESQKTAWANLFGATALLCLIIGIFCAAMVLIPRLDGGPSQSLLFFGKVVTLNAETYKEQFREIAYEQLLDDWTAQIHFNARIAQKKHEWVRKCLYWSLFGAMPWLAAIFAVLAPW